MTGKRKLGATCPKCGACLPGNGRYYATLLSLVIVTLAIVGTVWPSHG